ncbi:multiple C2 and transmembrane domain-containing protein 2-like isoform X2 [Gasterosteus aculeatus]
MDVKKKNFLENFRLPKLINLKKPRKKDPAKQGRKPARKLAYRRSISVPDLRLVPVDALPSDGTAWPSRSEGVSLGPSAGQSDSDSVASGSIADGKLYTDRLNDSFSDSRLKVPSGHRDAALNRVSAPVGSHCYEEIDGMMGPRPQRTETEDLFAQLDPPKKLQRFVFDPIPAPRSACPKAMSPRSDIADRRSVSGEDAPGDRVGPGAVAALLARASSMGEQIKPYTEKRGTPFEYKTSSSEKGTPPAIRLNTPSRSVAPEAFGPPAENADGNSWDSDCGSATEERVNLSWNTDSEGREISWRSAMQDFTSEAALLNQAEAEAQEETAEMSSETCDVFDENQDLLENPAFTTGLDVQTPDPWQRYLLNINLNQGKNLVIRGKRSGNSDPYVKFKLEGKQFYKSKVIYKTLNPRWNESFSHPLRDREHAVDVRVYNKNRTADEFMGSSSIILNNLELYKTYEMELQLDNPKSKEDDMGVIVVDICLMFRDATIKRSPRWPPKKNKNMCIQDNPQWREQFHFNHFGDNQEPLQVEVYSKRGRKCEESWGMVEVDLMRLNEMQLFTKVLDPGKGKLVFLVTRRPCWGVSISDIETGALEKPDEKQAILERFSLKNSHKCVGEVGFLQVKVVKANDIPATDLNGKSNPFCVVELGNSKLQSHTIYKTLNPEWNKAFTFPIKDIHDVIELTLLDENGDKAPNFLGKVAIPLLAVKNGKQVCLSLKKENLGAFSKGTITLVLDVIFNKVRAGIRTFQPKESKLVEENQKFSKKVLARNIYRVRNISTAVLYTLQYIKSCFQWESRQRSLIAFLIFLVTVWHWELFMLPLFLLLLIGWHYFQLTGGKISSNQDLVNISMGDDEDEDEKEPGKKGLMDKIHMVQEVVLVVQNVLEEIANIGERIKNIFNWSVPFLSCLCCLVLFVTTALLYFIPLRYIVLIWGFNKFTKKLRNPYTIDNNEILDFLKRVPSDVQKVQRSALRAPASQTQPRRRK